MKKQLTLRKQTIANFKETAISVENQKTSSLPCGVIITLPIKTITELPPPF